MGQHCLFNGTWWRGTGNPMDLVTSTHKDECWGRHHVVPLSQIRLLVHMNRYDTPTIGMIVRESLKMRPNGSTWLTPSAPKIDDNSTIFGEQHLVQLCVVYFI